MFVDIANEVGNELAALPDDQARWRHVRDLVDRHEVVIGVWQDAAEPDGVGQMIIKGDRLLRAIGAGDTGRFTSISAIPCIQAEQAVALKQVAGELPDLH
jgi:hypothetical protein